MRLIPQDWRNRLADGSPKGYIFGGIHIGSVGVPAHGVLTMEFGLVFTIGFIDMPAHEAAPRGVARIHWDQRNTCLLRFVGQIVPQLAKGPGAVLPSLRPTNRCCGALTDVRQILHPQGRPEGTRVIDSFLPPGSLPPTHLAPHGHQQA